MGNVAVTSRKTGITQVLSEKDAKEHMQLHGRRFSAKPAEEFTPEEAQETAPTTRRKALPQGSAPVTENEQPAS